MKRRKKKNEEKKRIEKKRKEKKSVTGTCENVVNGDSE
jgi:hypothetical protein